MAKVSKIIGIDISKEKFDACFSFGEDEKSVQDSYSYDEKGIRLFLKEVQNDCICVMEATGVYHLRLAYALHDCGLSVSIVNPLSVKNFSRAVMCRTKTDKTDARLLVEYARRMEITIWEPTPSNYIRIQQLYRSIELFQQNILQAENQLEAIGNSPVSDSSLTDMLRKHIRQLRRRIESLKKQLDTLLRQEDGRAINNICSIPGVGKKTAIALLTATKGMHGFKNYKQVSSYFGLCPRIYDSGKSVHGKAHICKMGMGWIRKLLYMCSVSAIRCNRACGDLYERLREKGKPVKVAMIAVANKLLKQIFAIVKNNQAYSEIYAI